MHVMSETRWVFLARFRILPVWMRYICSVLVEAVVTARNLALVVTKPCATLRRAVNTSLR